MELLDSIQRNAARLDKMIVLPESYEERTLKAANYCLEKSIARITLLGKKEKVLADAQRLNLSHIIQAEIVDPLHFDKQDEYATRLAEIRKSKGLTKDEASKLLQDPLYFAVMMIKMGDADGEVAGADNATGDVLRPAFQIVKTMPGISVVSGAFMMILKDQPFGENGLIIFADCAVHPDPNAAQLAEIAISTAHTAKNIARIEPRIAMLSFSTMGSAQHPMVDKVREATEIVKKNAPDLKVDGEMQADAAIIEKIGQKKAPGSDIAGKANVLIFPDLQSGNIAYKLVQRMAGAEAVGPVLQGMAAPINDLSRGCSVDDIINMIAISANQAGGI